MNLYTVTIDFDDHARAIFQSSAKNEISALNDALRHSEAMADYDKAITEQVIAEHLSITHIAMDYKGVWIWHHTFNRKKGLHNILGGLIVQTAKEGAVRKTL